MVNLETIQKEITSKRNELLKHYVKDYCIENMANKTRKFLINKEGKYLEVTVEGNIKVVDEKNQRYEYYLFDLSSEEYVFCCYSFEFKSKNNLKILNDFYHYPIKTFPSESEIFDFQLFAEVDRLTFIQYLLRTKGSIRKNIIELENDGFIEFNFFRYHNHNRCRQKYTELIKSKNN